MKLDNFKIGNANISNTNPDDVVKRLESFLKTKKTTYICVSNMRMVRYANKKVNNSYLKIMNNSYMNLPDGTPLVWCGRLWGSKKIQRTSGPDFFQKMLKKSDDGLKHFLLGDTNETLDEIIKSYKTNFNSNIVGSFSPPFIDVDEYDYKGIADIINESKADIVWVSMRAPKQDIFSSKISPLLDSKICISVGRAFRIAIGEVKDAPNVFQRLGLAGIFTRRVSLLETLKFYFITFFYLVFYMGQILVRRTFRKK